MDPNPLRYSREYLERLAGETAFQPDMLEKVLRLERVLDQAGRHPFLQTRLLLKGGTALNLFYGQAPRLSVDLDFNYIGAVARKAMLQERPEIERALEQIAKGEEYNIQQAAEEHAGRKFYLNYWNAFGSQDRIEIDVNYMFRVPLVPSSFREGWTPDRDAPCRAWIVGFEEVMVGKLLALLDRRAARDLYDAASLEAMGAYDVGRFRRVFIALSGILPRALTAYDIGRLGAFTQDDLDRELAPFLRSTEHATPEALAFRVGRILAPLLHLSPEEQEYVERLQWGEFRPELIVSGEPDLLDQLRVHPALMWKVENARKRSRR